MMSRANFTTGRPVEYLILVEPRPDGPVIGYYADHAIADAVVDYFGRRFTYAGIAPRLRNGWYDVDALRPGEWIVEPGLIYFAHPREAVGPLKKLRGSDYHRIAGSN